MDPKEIKKHARRAIRESKIAAAIRHILIASFGASVSVLAQASTGDLATSGKNDVVKFNSSFIHGLSVDVSRFYE
ncbi:hypothetical protein, partial [Raoultella ornithinolytica]